MVVKEKLVEVAGAENVLDDPKILEEYSKDYSLVSPGKPEVVVRPKDVDEVQKIVRLANESKTPIVPSSSGVHFYGGAIPKHGGVLLDLQRLNTVTKVDGLNKHVYFDVGVTWEQLVNELAPKGWRAPMTLLPHPARSVAIDLVEREPMVSPQWEYNDPLRSFQVIYGNGEEFVTGSGAYNALRDESREVNAAGVNPQGPGTIDFYHFLEAAQGTMGVITWAIMKMIPARAVEKVFFIPAAKVDDLIDPMYWILRRRVGKEFFILNNTNLATILTEKWPEQFKGLAKAFAPWTGVLVLGALDYRPEEKIAYEVEFLEDLPKSRFSNLKLETTLPGFPGAESKLPEMLAKPWPKDRTYWKHALKGSCQDLMFMTTLERVPPFIETVKGVAAKNGFAEGDIGCYIQPIEAGRVCQLQFNLYHSPDDVAKVETVYREAVDAVLEQGAYFTRPYGMLKDVVYKEAGDYVALLKRVKKLFDPNSILSPGNLCL